MPPSLGPHILWLPLATVLSFGFGQLFKWSQSRGRHAPTVVAVNYLALALALGLYFAASGQNPVAADVILVGATTGLCFIVSMHAMTYALAKSAAGPVLTAFRLALVVPIVASVWLWEEPLAAVQAIGIVAALLALGLMTRPSGPAPGAAPVSWLVPLVFMLQGLSQCGLRWVHYAGLDERRLHVLFFIALTAGLLGLPFIVGRRLQAADVRMGVGIGLFNLTALAVLLTALSRIPGAVFFPVHGCAVVLLDNICAWLVWRENLGLRAVAGAVLAAAAMLLVL